MITHLTSTPNTAALLVRDLPLAEAVGARLILNAQAVIVLSTTSLRSGWTRHLLRLV